MKRELSLAKARELFERDIEWIATGNPDRPYAAEVEDRKLEIQLNADYPEVDAYTLILDEGAIADFNDWPMKWVRPDEETSRGAQRATAETPIVRDPIVGFGRATDSGRPAKKDQSKLERRSREIDRVAFSSDSAGTAERWVKPTSDTPAASVGDPSTLRDSRRTLS